MLKKYYPKIITPALVLADIIAITASLLLAYYIYHQIDIEILGMRTSQQPFHLYIKLSIFFNIALITIFERLGLYKRHMSILNIEEMKKIFKGVVLGALLLFMTTFYSKDLSFSRLITSYSVIIMFVLINAERFLFFKLHQYLHLKGIGVKIILIYGSGEVGRLLAKRLMHSPRLGLLPVGFIDDDVNRTGKKINGGTFANPKYLPIFGGLDDMETTVRNNKVDEVFIAMPSVENGGVFNVVEKCREIKIKYSFVPNLFGLKVQKVAYEAIDGIPLLSLKEHKINQVNTFIKRGFDVIFSVIALVILSPLIVIISILIKRDSKGPVIFKHERVGKKGKFFEMHKFRTMYVDTPKFAYCPDNSNDPRITKFGRFLRKTSVDELPQFWNVLKGNMSVVGPRPEMPFIVDTYNELQRERLAVKPGITGLWQISTDRGGQIHDDIDYDLYYIENMSILLDVVIILRTIAFAIRGIGAF